MGERERIGRTPLQLRSIYTDRRLWAVLRSSGKCETVAKSVEKKSNSYPPNPISEYKTHWDAAVLEQPGFFGNATEELSHELFTSDGLGYVSDKVQLRVYYIGARAFVFSGSRHGKTYLFPMERYQRRGLRFLINKSTCPS